VIWSSAALKKNFLNQRNYAGLALFLLPFLLYGYSVTFDYVLDDKLVVSENAFVKKGLSGIWDIVTKDSFAGLLGERTDLVAGGRYRPLSIITFAIEYQFFGLRPALSHFVNVLLYALTGLLLFRVLSLCSLEEQDRPFGLAQGGQWFLRLPFVASLLFVLHPIHSEVVANIKGRDEILALMFSLSALYFCIKATNSAKYRYWLISGLAFLLALLAKENAVTFLAVVPLYLYFFSKSTLRQFGKLTAKQTSVATLTLFAAVLVYTAIRYKALGYLFDGANQITDLMNNPFAEATISQKYATIFYTLGLYVKLLFFPHPLTHDYYPYHIPLIDLGNIRAWGSLLLYIAMLGYAVVAFKRRNVTAFCIFYFLITLSIVSNLIFPVGTFMSERFMFMPSVGFCLILAFWLTHNVPTLFIQNQKLSRQFSIFLLILVCLGYSIKTVTRVPAWKNTMSLNSAGVKVSPDSARANCFMGYALYREAREVKADAVRQMELYKQAEFYIDKALAIYPAYANALNIKAGLLGGYFEHNGDLDRLLDGFYEIMKVRHVPYAIQYLGHLNRRQEYSSKLADFYHRVGFVLVAEQQKDYPLAEKYLNYGLGVAPDDVQLILDLTMVYYMWGDYQKALKMAQRGLALNSSHPELKRYVELASKGLSEQEH
jgi:tetratricopeptide (TPR) repeat protein